MSSRRSSSFCAGARFVALAVLWFIFVPVRAAAQPRPAVTATPSAPAAAPPASSAPPAAPPAAPASAPAAAPSADDKQLAREHFDRGVKLFNERAWAPALAEFLESRKLYRTRNATANAAICLKELGRYDEALDMYAALLQEFGDKLTPEAKQAALQEIEETKRLVGTIEVEGSEVGAAIVVDQQNRGDYPLLSPLRVAAGSHIVRVYKEGFEPFETKLDVAGGTTGRVAAKLRKLTVAGSLQVVEAQDREIAVFVDGFKVGATPLKTPLAPGKHTIFLRGDAGQGGGTIGTMPIAVTIRLNEAESLRLEAEALNAVLRVEPTPFDALVSVDSVILGRGQWEGHVKPGKHIIEAAADGFLPERREVAIDKSGREVVSIALPRDPKSPFWRKPPPPPHFLVEMGAGLAIVPSFGGAVAGACVQGCATDAGVGAYGALHGGYELSSRLSFGLSLGYLSATQRTRDRATTLNVVFPESPTAAGRADDKLQLGGVFVGAWGGYTFEAIEELLPIHLRLGAGGLFGTLSDTRTGRAFVARDESEYGVGPAREIHGARFVYVTPEARIGLTLSRHVELNAGLAVPILFAVSPPVWSEDHAINAGPDGYGWFNGDSLVGNVVVTVVPMIGARFDL